MSPIIEIDIVNWAKFNPRSDRKISIWFRLDNDFFYDPKLWSLTDSQRLLFLFLLCEASKVQQGSIKINVDMVASLRKTTVEKINEELQLLVNIGVLSPPVGGQTPDKIPATRQYNTIQEYNNAQNPKQPKQPSATPDGFAEFYSEYPKKVGKTQAMKAWKRERGKPGFLMAEILAAREKYRAYCVKSKCDQKFIKHPSTFLSEWRDWLDPNIGTTSVDGRNYSDLAKDLWEFKKGTLQNPPPELENFIQQVNLDKLHRDDFRGGGAVSGMIKKFFEKGLAKMNSPPAI